MKSFIKCNEYNSIRNLKQNSHEILDTEITDKIPEEILYEVKHH